MWPLRRRGLAIRAALSWYSVPAMIRQLLITLAVAVIVILIARMKRGRAESRSSSGQTDAPREPSRPSTTMLVGYALAALTILATAGVSWMRYQEANEIVQVEVVDARSGTRTIYQVRRKELGDRAFRTVDGRVVSLGASDRMVRIE